MRPTFSGTVVARTVGAELVRSRRTVVARLLAAGLIISAFQGLGWALLSTRSLEGWPQLLAWQSAYLTALMVPFAALLGVLVVRREQRGRQGGTDWRPVSPLAVRGARLGVTAFQLLLFHVSITGPTLLWGRLAGLAHPPVGRILAVALLGWLLALLPLAFGLFLARRLGTTATVLLSISWQVLGTLHAEDPLWFVQPWTWAVHPLLPLLGVHANGVPLPDGSPAAASAWQGACMASLALTVAMTLVGPIRPRTRRRPAAPFVHRGATGPMMPPVVRTEPRTTVALMSTLRRSGLAPSALATAAGLAVIGVLWGADGVRGTLGYLVLPLGSCLVATRVWQVQEPAWRSVATRDDVAQLALRLFGGCAVAVLGLSVVAASAVRASGGEQPIAFAVVAATSGAAMVMACLYLAARFGVGAAVGVMLVAMLIGVVLGGSFRDTPLWLAGPAVWAASATTTARECAATGLSVLATLALAPAWTRAARARAGAGERT